MFSSGGSSSKFLTKDRLNPHLLNAQYAVRGELAIRAEELKTKIAHKDPSLAFDKIINCNIGNPQQLDQHPITFFRQVLSLLEYPELLKKANEKIVPLLYPLDAIERARFILTSCGGQLGAYSHSKGIPFIRQSVADFIERRDGYPADPEHIFLTAGASPAVQMVLNAIIQNENVGILIPIPQYPLYSASLALYNGKMVPYYLDEDNDWSLSVSYEE